MRAIVKKSARFAAIAGALLVLLAVAIFLDGAVTARALRVDAESACRCQQRSGQAGKRSCWASFDKEFAALSPDAAPRFFCEAIIRPNTFLWSRHGWQHRITTRYSTWMDNDHELTLCTPEEAATVEQAVGADWDKYQVVRPATRELVRGIARGQPFTPVLTQPSCG